MGNVVNLWSGGYIKSLPKHHVLVFGSNPEGRHGAGAARAAADYLGAVMGKGRGLMGNSYALPTKNLTAGFVERLPNGKKIEYPLAGFQSITPLQIIENISELMRFAVQNPHLNFYVGYMNDGKQNLNGYTADQMWDMFAVAGMRHGWPRNLYMHDTFYFHARDDGLEVGTTINVDEIQKPSIRKYKRVF